MISTGVAGQLWFDNVRVPREDMLDAYASVAPDGPHPVAYLLLHSGVCMCHKKVNGIL